MDCKSVGDTIATLRKKLRMTQLELATLLDVSDKTVSKWETGQGYPDITLFPRLAEVFGVSVDHLLANLVQLCALIICAPKRSIADNVVDFAQILQM